MRLDWSTALSVWWSFFWRTTLYCALAGFGFGFLFAFIASVMNAPASTDFYATIAGYLVLIPASMLAIKQALEKHTNPLRAATAELA